MEIKPLNDPEKVVQLLADIAQISREKAKERLTQEAGLIGTNVLNALQAQNIPLYTMTDKMEKFYQDNDAFLFEITMWNASTIKGRLRDFIANALKKFNKNKANIFCFGDGLGFDSTYFAKLGHNVKYYDPSLLSQKYSKHLFTENNVYVMQLTSMEDITPGSLDVLICLDVLEHVPNPASLVKKFHSWLKPDGLLVVSAPFWAINPTLGTHLQENRVYSGNKKKLYSQNNFKAIECSFLWDPIIFKKSDAHFETPISVQLKIVFNQWLLFCLRRRGVLSFLLNNLTLKRIIGQREVPVSWREYLK
jgi:SAM-dependent methyltransferase